MVEKDRTPRVMLPEEKVARRFSIIRELKPPVDVETLVREAADLEEDKLPGDYDAVFLERSQNHPKPRVILNRGQPLTRKRFTLAHELGHIVIPWHNGTHFCRIDGGARLVDHLVKQIEAQANRFAAELLVPCNWVNDLVKTCQNFEELGKVLKSANVSYHVISIRLTQLLSHGFLFVELDSNNVVVRCSASSNVAIQLPQVGSKLVTKNFDLLAEDKAVFTVGSSAIVWWRLSSKVHPPKLSHDTSASVDILRHIISEVYSDLDEAKAALTSVNGIIGAANGGLREGQDLFTVLKQRFLARVKIRKIVEHPNFETFLAKKAEELNTRVT